MLHNPEGSGILSRAQDKHQYPLWQDMSFNKQTVSSVRSIPTKSDRQIKQHSDQKAA